MAEDDDEDDYDGLRRRRAVTAGAAREAGLGSVPHAGEGAVSFLMAWGDRIGEFARLRFGQSIISGAALGVLRS